MLPTILEASDAGSGALQIASFRNAKTNFTWVGLAQPFSPMVTMSQEQTVRWQPQSAAFKDGTLALRATSADGLEAELLVAAYDDTGAFRWQQAYRNDGKAATSTIVGVSALDLELSKDVGDLVVHCVRRDSDYFREALPFRTHVEVAGGGWNAPRYAGLIVLEATGYSEFLIFFNMVT